MFLYYAIICIAILLITASHVIVWFEVYRINCLVLQIEMPISIIDKSLLENVDNTNRKSNHRRVGFDSGRRLWNPSSSWWTPPQCSDSPKIFPTTQFCSWTTKKLIKQVIIFFQTTKTIPGSFNIFWRNLIFIYF